MLISAQHKINIPIKKILIIQLGDIGDVVWAIPAFQAVKTIYPHAALTVLTRKPYGDLLLDDHHIDKVFQTGKEGMLTNLWLLIKLRREKFDLTFDFRADDRGTIITFLARSKIRAALYYPGWKWRNRVFTHLVDPLRQKERVYGAAEQSLKILRGFGIKEKNAIPKIFVSQTIRDNVLEILSAEKIDTSRRFITINPFSRWPYKEWDINKWKHLISFVWGKYKIPSLITGSEEERKKADAFSSAMNFPVYNMAGKSTLRELAALLQMSRLHIGVDSAAPQIAAAVGTPTLTIYGPSDWREWAPPGEKNKVVIPDMDCSPCHKKGCSGSGRSDCLDNLSVAKVQDAVEIMLNNFVFDKL
ncbi:MAG: glycosyltransferase family 9 protein [Smithellaceae bacterium]|jgi:heptosyltransferase-3